VKEKCVSALDVPSPIDLRQWADAQTWAAQAMVKRPWRVRFFDHMVLALQSGGLEAGRVLELGSGPGFLARHMLCHLPELRYTALDFSPAMHQLAGERLGPLSRCVRFVERDFKALGWQEGLGLFDSVVTMQAVHELRHKRHAVRLHTQVREMLAPQGCYLVCDHHAGEGGMRDEQLYMSVDEQRHALLDAGFTRVDRLLLEGGLVLHRAG
jgi:SAM-dependent methyltransferase